MDLNRFDKCWFAIQVRPRYEFITASILRSKGYAEFMPSYKSKRRWSDREKEIELPLFPGYVFCRFDARIQVPILTTPGVMQIVGANLPIPDSEIEAIQAIVAQSIPAAPCPYLKVGTRVQVITGPLAGVQGLLVFYKDQCRLVLSVNLVTNSVSVEVDRYDVIPVQENIGSSTMLEAASYQA
ncbi:MAG: transcription termination/antitermination NusG family protein [Candidatus Angelobacter sp.]